MNSQDVTGKEKIKKVFVGVSGGVDSSVALALLVEQGYDVTGVFLKVWSPDWLNTMSGCEWRDERRSAMRVCATLGVPFLTLDCEQEYKEKIVDYMIAEYSAGQTPNPDVFCNKYVKFGVFLDKARAIGADAVATGHYAQVRRLPGVDASHTSGLLEAVDTEKDQSYFLHQLGQEQLSRALFPIGHLVKSEVRALAKKFHLPTATKKDSQGLCFIGKVDMKEFLAHYVGDLPVARPGDVLDEHGTVIGRHDGAVFYTIGERHGFEIFKKSTHDGRAFVLAKNMENNTITVGERGEKVLANDAADCRNEHIFLLRDIHWVSGQNPDLSRTYDVRFRYHQEKQKCRIGKIVENLLDREIRFEIIAEKAQFGVAPGQSAVVYDGDVCLGGGVIV